MNVDDCVVANRCWSPLLANFPPDNKYPFRKEQKEKNDGTKNLLTVTTSSGAPFTIWNSLRMKPDGLPPSVLLGGGLGAVDRLAVARRLMVLLFGLRLFCSVGMCERMENDTAEKRGKLSIRELAGSNRHVRLTMIILAKIKSR